MGIEIMAGAAISSLVGAYSAHDQARRTENASRKQTEANRNAMNLQQRGNLLNQQRYMDLAKEYDDWKNIYGSTQEDLATYYKNLTGETLSNREIGDIQAARQRADEKIRKTFSQDGRDHNGAADFLIGTGAYQAEIDKQNARANAEEQVRQAKLGFLSVGLGDRAELRNRLNATARAINTGYGNQGNIAMSEGVNQVGTANKVNSIYGNYFDDLTDDIGAVSGYNEVSKKGTTSRGANI